ncbi:MAG: type II toxin-antitoxin system HicB family antitoxin [Clostridiales Family XIII bacterium]|jgi:predicted RNase H-like HicB family nuclease|nr:type II toxin-antitoxin system HicB family antitoxin [Clostridiales Family XIII bacterium]
MEYVYAALFEQNDDGSFTVTFPDIPGCITEGKHLSESLLMAEKALRQRIEYVTDKGMDLPAPTPISDIPVGKGEFANLVCASVHDTSAVRRTVSIPKWLDERAKAAGLSLSRVLQDELKERL